MTKSNQYSTFSSGDSIPKNRKRECANEAQTLVVWAFSNVIQNWMRNRNTVEFLAVWEELHNLDFNRVQFEAVRSEAGLNRFVMTPTKWIEQTNAIGIVSKQADMVGELMHIAILQWHLLHGFLRNFNCIL